MATGGHPDDARPLRVDWLDQSSLGDRRPGRLGLTLLPGKQGASIRYPGRVYRRDLGADLASLQSAGVSRLVLLVEDHELERWGDPAIARHAAEVGIAVDRWPLPDGRAPASASEMRSILAAIAAGREISDVAVACMGGVGRSGTVAACALVAAGWEAEAAIAEARRVRHPTAVETPEQEAFVRAFARDAASSAD